MQLGLALHGYFHSGCALLCGLHHRDNRRLLLLKLLQHSVVSVTQLLLEPQERGAVTQRGLCNCCLRRLRWLRAWLRLRRQHWKQLPLLLQLCDGWLRWRCLLRAVSRSCGRLRTTLFRCRCYRRSRRLHCRLYLWLRSLFC